jgi:hypothetical protein
MLNQSLQQLDLFKVMVGAQSATIICFYLCLGEVIVMRC